MADFDLNSGRKELREALFASRRLLFSVFLFSIFVNLLMLTGPLFMLNVYDRVLTSNSRPTLWALFGLVALLFLLMGLLDHARARVLARAGDAPDFSALEARLRETQSEVRRVFTSLLEE